jgi:acyl carrier protein
VEAVLARHPVVGQVAVLAREDRTGDKRLVAYVVPADTEADVAAVRAFAREHLPGHLVPSVFVTVDQLPLTPNGKLDRRALPPPSGAAQEAGRAYETPRTLAEKAVARVWSDVLGVRPVGIRDDFFELGGDSFLAIQVVSRLHNIFRVKISLRTIFQAPTIADLIDELAAAAAAQQHLL